MKDELDTKTGDAFQVEKELTLEELAHPVFIQDCLSTGGHYQAVRIHPDMVVSGRRYAGSKTPDAVRDLWSSPRDVVAYMAERYGAYDLDAAASASNTVCEKFYDEKTNCLKRWWGKNKHVWLNPPYSNPLPFVEKAAQQAKDGNQIDILLPADNSTAWFRLAQMNAAEIIWVVADIEYHIEDNEIVVDGSHSGRLAFISGDTGKPVDNNNKGSVIFVMRELKEGEQQQTNYISVGDLCPSVKNKRMRKVKR